MWIHFWRNIGIVSGQYPLEECGGNIGGPLSQMSEAVNKIDNGSNQSNNNNNNVNGMGSSMSGLSSSNEMFSNNNKVNRICTQPLFLSLYKKFQTFKAMLE